MVIRRIVVAVILGRAQDVQAGETAGEQGEQKAAGVQDAENGKEEETKEGAEEGGVAKVPPADAEGQPANNDAPGTAAAAPEPSAPQLADAAPGPAAPAPGPSADARSTASQMTGTPKDRLRRLIASLASRKGGSTEIGMQPPCQSYENLIQFSEFEEIRNEITVVQAAEGLKAIQSKWGPFKRALNDLSNGVTASTKLLKSRLDVVKSSQDKNDAAAKEKARKTLSKVTAGGAFSHHTPPLTTHTHPPPNTHPHPTPHHIPHHPPPGT